MRSLCLILLLALPQAAGAADLKVTGRAGYLSEWEVSATARAAPDGREFAGPLVMRHTGLCTVDGPVEKAGDIRFRRTGWPLAGLTATIVIEGVSCSFSARGSASYDGFMKCPGTPSVPLSLSVE
ncbi:MAG: hypothetical protein HXX10_01065 [Rhodoplanes sp.]|uniref:hypothetical protein n=1 Tax=Rhodoplanes sp. TaxID=1968906 RepID=UPI0017DE8344|nr:hypothetical protein [Rhodoplanes sp.]NVO12603.1 hypothetical protein [Rhodoplanes sp.]